MSYTFAIHGEKPCINTLVENVRKTHKVCVKDSLINGLRCYFREKSTRGVDVVWNAKDNSLQIVTFICSTNEDYQLAFILAQQAANTMNANICAEGISYEVDAFLKIHNERWIEELENQYIHDLLSQIQNHETTVKIPCLFRDFYLGPNTAQKIECNANARQKLLKMIKDVIYFKDQNVFVANTIIMKHYNKSFCVWGPGINYLFPDCDLFGIISENGAPNTIPRKMIFELIPEKIKFLDEHHILVESLNEKEYNSICDTITEKLQAG
ncbi:DUF4299 family protein [Candidatus Uabimicrobium amorphum]|uniref:Uncharacterized protein n=1 Tax=Uabimicrobium amorphum TaxID=2596890 RepID=A0A5S9INM2_UABAM|nr:DUF4299 family protein [Candidatus Uabimicrobium amorphum]BBM84850.1 hypothetical protein UABAM_03211 [Candidatus Uabimicrobium amorphum]